MVKQCLIIGLNTLSVTGLLGKKEESIMEPLYTKEQKEAFLELSKRGLSCAFAFCENAFVRGILEPYTEDKKVRAEKINGVIYVPLVFFERLGAKVASDSGEQRLLLRGYTYRFVNERKEHSAFKKGNVTYVPAAACAVALGLCAETFCDDRLVAVADKELMDEAALRTELMTAASFLIFGEYPKSFSREQYAKARKRWKESLVGNEEINDLSDPVILGKIKALNDRCSSYMREMNYSENAVILFGVHAPTESEELCRQYDPLRDMAYAYATFGGRFYHDSELLKMIRFGLEWGYKHLYGEAEMTNSGWRDVHAFNWWYWYVGAPDAITNILLVMYDEFSKEERERYLKCFLWFMSWMSTTDASSLTRVVVCTKAGLILEKPEILEKEFYDYNHRLLLSTSGEFNGPHIDYVDWSHYMPYNVGYGQLNLDRVLYVASKLSGTDLAFRSPRSYNQFEMVKYMFEPAIHNCQAYVMFHGRNNHIKEMSAGVKIFVDMLDMIGVYGEEEDEYIKNLIRRNAKSKKCIDAMIGFASIYKYKQLKEILDRHMPSEPYNFAYSWYTGDRVAQHRNGYSIGISMNSYREKSYESINDMNLYGWYTSDGATYLYTDYDDGQFDGENFMFNPEIAHRIPGTTEDSRRREPRSVNMNVWYSPAEVAGGITVRDQFAIAGMDYVSEHFEGPEKPNTSGYGGTPAIFANDLRAKKAWFLFDGEIVCLGSGITSTMNSEVKTAIEHRRIVDDENREIVLCKNGVREILPKCDFERVDTGIEYICMEGHAGFALDKNAKVYLRRYRSSECQGQSFIDFGYVHGVDPTEEKYAYTIFPHATEDIVIGRSSSKSTLIISNEEDVQAAENTELGVCGYVFYKAGSSQEITTSSPLIVAVSREGDEIEYRFSEPTHKVKCGEITLRLEGAELIDCHKKLDVKVEKALVKIKADFDNAVGRPYHIKLKCK